MSLRDKIREHDCQLQFGFQLRIFRKQEASCVYFTMIQAYQQLRPKPQSSGLEVETIRD